VTEIERLVQDLEFYNRAYRNGQPLISDAHYDDLVEQLRTFDPDHPFLHTVEPEKFAARKEIRHPIPMLSLDKAYNHEQLMRFAARIEKEARIIGVWPVEFKVTPKLDGLAARDDGKTFVTRGNGHAGHEISSAFDKGIIALGGRGQGLGEIVVVKTYFDEHLADKFEHPRNMAVGIVSSDTLNQDARRALEDKKVHFVPYSQLPFCLVSSSDLVNQIDTIRDRVMSGTDYPMDGVVVSAIDEALQQHMGATNHHYRWQIAVKRKGEAAETRVENVLWQVGRTGNVTPVLEVHPVSLSGATIRRVTAHHAGMVGKLRIGPGARIEIIRSGEVIPKLERVLQASDQVIIPQSCPICNQPLSWKDEKSDFLRCTNLDCPAQTEQRIVHFFKILGNADWFGIKTIQKLVAAGFDSLEKVYSLGVDDFIRMGFGPVQSKNLEDALQSSRTIPVEDWRFLAALGIPDLGIGDSRRLLQHIPLADLLTAEAETIAGINGFGDVTSRSIVQGIEQVKETIQHMLALGFNLQVTPLESEVTAVKSPLSGKRIVFTGKMERGDRTEMQAQARRLGAHVQTAVAANTDYLVCGRKVGAAKIDKASRFGVQIISEESYYGMFQAQKN
jgi:DNA ligase (NAD+)